MTNLQVTTQRIGNQLLAWLTRQCNEAELNWLRARQSEVEAGTPTWKLFTAFSAATRHVRKEDLRLDDLDLEAANDLREGWTPVGWSLDEAARILLVLSFPHEDEDTYVTTIERVFSTADARESIALYRALPLYPFPERFRARATEGIRSNITPVFNAVAHRNPYPREYFDEGAWNQLVLKALFVDSTLCDIQGLDERANPVLARMLVDYAHERWAAGRSVSPELWRPVGRFAGGHGRYLEELTRVLERREAAQREAAALALADSGMEAAMGLLETAPDLKQRVESGELDWASFSQTHVAGSG